MNDLHRLTGLAFIALMASACAEQNMTNESGPNDLSDQAPSFSAIPGAGVVVDFENPTYTPGSIDGQDDWLSTGSYDQAVVTNASPPAPESFGTQSLRISNAITSGSFGDQTFSKRLLNAAGETTAEDGGFALGGGVRQNHFEAQWQFASFVPGTEQTGLAVSASPDRGDGSRMSFVRMTDTPTGLAVAFVDVPGVTDPSDFVETSIASGLSRAAPHTIKITMDLVDGESNDVVKVYIDGALKHTGTSWENYYRHDSEASAHNGLTPIVNRILFRAGGTAAGTPGNGFLIDDFSLKSSMFTGTPCAFTTAGTTMTLIADCTTSESILIPNGFTLDGANHTITAVDPPAPDHFLGAVVRNGGASANVINLTVTASGLADVCDGGDDRLRGILLDAASGSITNNTLTGIRQGASGCQEGNSIEVRNAPFEADGTDLAVTISGNVVSSYQKTGILANGSVAATITGNTVTGAGPVGYIAQNGIQIGFGGTAAVKNNTVSGNSYTGPDVACGILLFQAGGVKVSSNNLFNNERDMCNFGKGGGKFNPSN